MTLTVEGDYAGIERVPTGFWSLDRALSNGKDVGWPMTIYEIFGFQGIGKTTFSTSIAGIVAEHYKKNIVYAPVEHVDREYMINILQAMGFEQTVSILGGQDMVKKFLPHLKMKGTDIVTDEILFDCLIAAVRQDDYCFSILDSLTAISPIEESDSSTADKNMGRRARLVGVLVRGLLQASRFRSSAYSTVLLSHKVTPLGGGTPTNTGSPTTGGESKKNIAKVRMSLRRVIDAKPMSETSAGVPYDNHAYVLEGKVEKLNFGREGRKFYTAILGGKGLHRGLTALYECKLLKLATFGASITLAGKKYGSMKSIVDKAHAGEDEFFLPFIDCINNQDAYEKVEETDEVWEDGDE